MKFHIDDTELASCVSCGLCLPHCPTFRVTGEEALSPRGRIAAIRSVHLDAAPVTDEFVSFMETCVQCRGCEPACPSGVPYGRLQEGVRETLAERHRITPRWQRAGFAVLPRHRLLLAGSTLLAVAQRLRLVPKRLGLARLPVRRAARIRPTGTDVWLFTGCVMDAWMRDTHRSTVKVLDHLGITFAVPGHGAGCCGALHTHAGLADHARKLATDVIAAMPGDAPIVVNSAGCGAALKEYGHLLGTVEAERFSARVLDVHELVAQHVERLRPTGHAGTVVVQDPCHLRHVQRAQLAVRTVLATCADLVELDDDGLCCGAGGAYSALHPELAADIRARKLEALARGCDTRERARGERQPRLRNASRRCGHPRATPHRPTRGGTVSGTYDHLADRLDAVADDLDEVMFDQLREASAARGGRPVDDKRLTQARRAVEKASRLLRGGTDD